jgi:membrane protein EpsK
MQSIDIMRNVVVGYGQLVLRFFISFWLTRFLIDSLGLELYGLTPLALSITGYFALITLIMDAPAARYLIMDVSKGDFQAANRTFNTVFFAVAALSSLILLCGATVSWFSPHIFKIPPSHVGDARILFFAVTLAFTLNTLGNPLSLATYVTNKLYLGNLSEIMQLITRASIAVLFIIFASWRLGAVSLGIIAAAVVGFIMAGLYWKILTPQLSIDRKSIDILLLKEITGIGGWTFIDQVGSLLILNSELIVVNRLFGAEGTGRYGALLIIPSTMRVIAQVMCSSSTPPVMKKYALGDAEGVIRILQSSTRLIAVVMALPIGLICGLAGPLLTIWLGKSFSGMAPVLVIMCAHLCVNVAVLPFFPVQLMLKKVKVPALVTCASGVMSIILAIILSQPNLKLGLSGVAIAAVAGFSARNVIFTVPYAATLLKQKWSIFLPSLAKGLCGFLVSAGLALFTRKIIDVDSYATLLLTVAITGSAYLVFTWHFLLKTDDKKWLVTWAPRLLRAS